MTGWKIIHLRITSEERKVVEKYMQEHHFKNYGQFLRKAIEDVLGISFADSTRNTTPLSPRYLAVREFYEEFRHELAPTPEILKKFDETFENWKISDSVSWSTSQNTKFIQADKMFGTFRKHNPVGKPKTPKGKSGRPKNMDKGYER